jgi:hypothetical protein
MTPPDNDHASITVSDSKNGKVGLALGISDDLADESALSKIAAAVLEEIQSGIIDEDIPFDAEREGEAMLVFENDDEDDINVDVVMNPTVTLATGAISPAQALALSSLRHVEQRYGIGLFELVDVKSSSDFT